MYCGIMKTGSIFTFAAPGTRDFFRIIKISKVFLYCYSRRRSVVCCSTKYADNFIFWRRITSASSIRTSMGQRYGYVVDDFFWLTFTLYNNLFHSLYFLYLHDCNSYKYRCSQTNFDRQYLNVIDNIIKCKRFLFNLYKS